METITESLGRRIPQGNWCNNGGRIDWCPFFEVKPSLSKDSFIQSYFCQLLDSYITRKECGINEALNE